MNYIEYGEQNSEVMIFLHGGSDKDFTTLESNTAKIYILVGEKETRAMKISAERIHRKLPGSSLKILAGSYHGEFSLNNSDSYVEYCNCSE